MSTQFTVSCRRNNTTAGETLERLGQPAHALT